MTELNWINTARQFIGMREVKGTKHNQLYRLDTYTL